MDYLGKKDSRKMPQHFFAQARNLDHDSAVKADITQQNYSVVPRYWYLDATFKCSRCDAEFCFSAVEQQYWYEVLKFYVDAYPKGCPACRRDSRRQMELRRSYDHQIDVAMKSNDLASKRELADIIDELCDGNAEQPEKIHDNRRILAQQITRLIRQGEDG